MCWGPGGEALGALIRTPKSAPPQPSWSPCRASESAAALPGRSAGSGAVFPEDREDGPALGLAWGAGRREFSASVTPRKKA